MNDKQKEIVRKIVYTFAHRMSFDINEEMIENTINNLNSMQVDDAIDTILISLDDKLRQGMLSKDVIFLYSHLLLSLNPEKYKSNDDLIQRLNWLKEMNLEHPAISLSQNHQLVVEVFDKFNELLRNRFDCYYTGGLMGYFATNHCLERYHGDLDLFINEQQLMQLKQLIDLSSVFKFESNMDHKEVNGHEYKITYKDTPMSIGLFLFERKLDGSITTKEYYYENEDKKLYVDEHHHSKRFTDLTFSDEVKFHNEIPYKMMSLESIYNSKKNGRPKDKYDASIIKSSIDELVDYKIDIEKRNNYDIKHKPCMHSIVQVIETNINDFNKEEKSKNK